MDAEKRKLHDDDGLYFLRLSAARVIDSTSSVVGAAAMIIRNYNQPTPQ